MQLKIPHNYMCRVFFIYEFFFCFIAKQNVYASSIMYGKKAEWKPKMQTDEANESLCM